MPVKPLFVEPLSPEAFEAFGDVIEPNESSHHFPINGGNTERFHDLADLEPGVGGRMIVSIFRGQPRLMPFTVEMMERHPQGSQAFIPLSGLRYLVVVAAAGSTPEVEDLRCFLAQKNQGVNYARGVWHHPLLALDDVSDFLVLDRKGDGANCDEIRLACGGVITL